MADSIEITATPESDKNGAIKRVVRKHNTLLAFSIILNFCTLIPFGVAMIYACVVKNPNMLIAVLTACSGVVFLVFGLLLRKQDLYYYKKNIVTAVLEEKLKFRKYIFDHNKTSAYLKDICNRSIFTNPPEIDISDSFKANYRGVEFSFYDFNIHSPGSVSSLNWMGQLIVMMLNKPVDGMIIFTSKNDGADFDNLYTITTSPKCVADSDNAAVDKTYTEYDFTSDSAFKAALVKLKNSAQSKVTVVFSYSRVYLFMENIFDPFEPSMDKHALDQMVDSLRQERELLLSALDPLIDADIVK